MDFGHRSCWEPRVEALLEVARNCPIPNGQALGLIQIWTLESKSEVNAMEAEGMYSASRAMPSL